MSQLQKAMQQAEDRKRLVSDENGIVLSRSEFEDRAVFSGFDIEYEELVGTSTAVGEAYCHGARVIGLRALFISAWCDGLLTGLLLASLPPASTSGVTDDTGPEVTE